MPLGDITTIGNNTVNQGIRQQIRRRDLEPSVRTVAMLDPDLEWWVRAGRPQDAYQCLPKPLLVVRVDWRT